MSKPPPILQLLDALAGSNNHNRDLKLVCSGISVCYHQSILFMYSPLLTSLLGDLSCCRCNAAQCGRKEEVVIVLDNVEVNAVQRLMEYLYRGECRVKDRKGFQEMQELVKMLGLTLKLDMHLGRVNYKSKEEEIMTDTSVENGKSEQKRNSECIKKFSDLIGQSEFEQECSKCGEALSRDTFKEHYVDHIKELQNYVHVYNSKSGEDDSEDFDERFTLRNVEVDNLDEECRLSRKEILCIDKLENGRKEINCTECGDLVTKNDFTEHLKSHSVKVFNLSKIETNVKKKRGPKSKTASRDVGSNKPNSIESTGGGVGSGFPSSITDVKEETVDKCDDDDPLKTDSDVIKEQESDEYTYFNPRFKIKPGTKVIRSSKKSKVKMPIPEIQLTFSLDSHCSKISQETIKLNELSSSTSKAGMKRKIRSNKEVSNMESKKRKLKVPSSSDTVSIKESSHKTSVVSAPSSLDSNSEDVNIFSFPSSSESTSFPSFLREVCERVDSILPIGLNREQEEQNRRLVHKTAVEKVCFGDECQIRQEDIVKDMGLDTEDDSETMNNISSDGSEVALVMDLPDQ